MKVSRAGRPWRRVVALVLERDGYACQLRLTGCQLVATTADHVIPFSIRPDLELDPGNLRASCRRCNLRRGTKPALSPTGPAPSARWAMILE